MKKDYKKEFKQFYKPTSKEVVATEVPKWNYLMIDGEGSPESQSFKDAIEALYPLAYTLKFMAKRGKIGIDYGVMPLEGLWWADDMSSFSVDSKDQWKWTLMIMQPDFITKKMVDEAMEQIKIRKNPASLPLVRFESFTEGAVAQIMHIGPFSEEGPTIEKVHAFIEENGKKKSGKHHEIYLSDFRRTASEKLQTVIRQSFKQI